MRAALLVCVGVVSCGRQASHGAEPMGPLRSPAPLVRPVPPSPSSDRLGDGVARYVVGEFCVHESLPQPQLFPLFARDDRGWTDEISAVRDPVATLAQRFNVLGFDGERRGEMVTEPGVPPASGQGFSGAYHGAGDLGPCNYVRPDGRRVLLAACGDAGGCGIAVALADQPKPPSILPASVCVTNGVLTGDLDGDGAPEAFSFEALRGNASAEGHPLEGAQCANPRFAWYRQRVGGALFDVLGVADLDGDGRVELMVAYYSKGGPRTVVLYSLAAPPALRLDRVAESTR